MHQFITYLQAGVRHIADLKGLEHIIFLAAICLRYLFNDWKKLLIIITAFTIGHLITSIFTVLNIIHFSSRWSDFFIAVTIIIATVSNLFIKKFSGKNKFPFTYSLALFYGLIHGLSASANVFSAHGFNLVIQFFAFNVGLELGQFIVALIILFFTFVCINLLKINRREYLVFVSGAILGIAIQMALNRSPF